MLQALTIRFQSAIMLNCWKSSIHANTYSLFLPPSPPQLSIIFLNLCKYNASTINYWRFVFVLFSTFFLHIAVKSSTLYTYTCVCVCVCVCVCAGASTVRVQRCRVHWPWLGGDPHAPYQYQGAGSTQSGPLRPGLQVGLPSDRSVETSLPLLLFRKLPKTHLPADKPVEIRHSPILFLKLPKLVFHLIGLWRHELFPLSFINSQSSSSIW